MTNSKKIIIFSFIFLLFLSSFAFLAPQEVIAQEEGGGGFVGDIVNAIGEAIAKLVLEIFDFLLKLGPMLLSFVLSDSFVNQSGSDSLVVQEGWNIVRNLANIALIIGLVIIAINIILGKEEGQAKKTLVNFVIVALLINFTPLLCGFFIDGANIIAKSFLQGGINSDMNNQIAGFGKSLTESSQGIFSVIVGIFALLIFTLISLSVYALYALLFVARAVILWILIIASPIALATKVFPKSNVIKKFFPSILYWDDWFEMFIQWVVIIIPASLFLYLGNKAMALAQMPAKEEGMEFIPFMVQSMFHFLIPIALLLAGFMITISSGGQVAAPIGALGKKAWGATAGVAGGYALGKAKSGASKTVAGAKAAGKWAKEGSVGMGAAVLTEGANPLKRSGRDLGRAKVEELKASVGGYGKKTKDWVGIGSGNSWAKKLEDADAKLKEDKVEFGGSNQEEVMAEYNLLNSRIQAGKNSGKLTEKQSEKMEEKMILAMINDKHFNNEKNLKGKEIIKANEEKITKIVSNYTGQDAIKNLKPVAFELPSVAKGLGSQPTEYILRSNRSTNNHSAALSKGIAASQKKETKTEGAKNIGGSSYAGNIAGINQEEQKLAGELDTLNKLGSNLTLEQEKRRDEVSDQLESLKQMR